MLGKRTGAHSSTHEAPCVLQTDVYLEELTDRMPEASVDTQTDAFMDRPQTPLYVPQKSGIDAETQILEGDLFDFDFEVRSGGSRPTMQSLFLHTKAYISTI
jgi:hypothetical protein